jgi:maltose O-acetyltransferase
MLNDKYGNQLSFTQAWPKIINRLYNYIVDIEVLVLRLVGLIPSHLVRKATYRLAGVKIGHGSTIHLGANFFDPKNVVIGQDTIVGDHCFLDGRDQLIIGNHVDIASQVLIYNSQHDIDHPQFKAINKPVIIEDYVFIGPRVVILPGVVIRKGAVVAAGAVVTKDVAEYSVVGGVPAREIRQRKLKDLNYRLGRARLFQ